MASRKEQKEQLRKEREAREAAAKAAARRRRLIGYGAGAAIVLVVLVVAGVLLASGGGGGGGGNGGGASLPDGGEVPEQKIANLADAAKAAGCKRKSFKAKSRDHTSDPSEKIRYASNPPTSGKHLDTPADDGAYPDAPDVKKLVHAQEHGRAIIWFKKSLPKAQRANLKALFDEDPYQMIITPDTTHMKYAAAVTAWNAEPQPNGTGRLLGCSKLSSQVYDAIRAFKEEYRSNGPEVQP